MMYNDPRNPEFERPEIPAPVGNRKHVVRIAAQEAINAHRAAFPDTEPTAPIYPTATFMHPMFEAVEHVEHAITSEINTIYQAIEQAHGAQNDLQNAA